VTEGQTTVEATLPTLLGEHVRSRPEEAALVCGDTRLTWSRLHDEVQQLAGALQGAGVGAGDRVLWLGQNCHRVVVALAACAQLGSVLCPVNWRQSVAELTFVLEDADPRVVFWQEDEVGPTIRAARDAVTLTARWIRHDDGSSPDGDETFAEFVASAASLRPTAPAEAGAAALMIYTGAFGGHPHGALLSHRALLTVGVANALVREMRPDDVFLNSGPLFHLGTWMCTLATYVVGATNVFVPRVDTGVLLTVIATERCTGAFLMPTTIVDLVAANATAKADLSSLRWSPSSTPEWDAMVSRDDSPWARRPGGTGQTEVGGMVTFSSLGGEGLHGRPFPLMELRVVSPEGEDVAVDEVGEMVVRGPMVMNGYHRRPEVNAEKFRGGWYHTGDLARRHRDGSVTFIAPMSRLIKSAAENIYPAEVEACLRQHPAVRAAAVIGVPDARWAQSVKAIVVLEDGVSIDPGALIEHCRATIASYKKPRLVTFVEELPMQGFAIDYDTLDAHHGGGGYPGGGNRSA
jgi:acyl-CoA synthetase (AMP-forming)/AMP-acid ligase II